ncbi:MAG: peptidase [Desulfobacteraceae bacterium]|nr:peptidase [Desulfobacteraceae bacterium]
MKNRIKSLKILALIFGMFMVSGACAFAGHHHDKDSIIDSLAPVDYVEGQMEKLAPLILNPDISYLEPREKRVLMLLVRASKILDRIFREQNYEDSSIMFRELKQFVGTPNQIYYDYFKVMQGPWDRLNEDEPFINLSSPKPLGANYYPADMTMDEFNDWILNNPDDEQDFISPFTMIVRCGDKLKAIAYSDYFRRELKVVARLLKRAARLTSDESLAKFLRSRAEAFFTNDYRESDIDWIGLNGDIEVVIGPYETYEDLIFGYKAAFESFVTLVDRDETAKLEVIEQYRDYLVENYPLPDGYDLTPKGLSSPIKVVNEVYSGGDARSGIATLAFNLPNDEWVRDNVGSKNVMLKNMLEAKFNGVLVPIKDVILDPKDRDKPSFDGFFNFTLVHELSHGLGPGNIVVDGKETTVREELKELYSTIEECQADVLSIFNNHSLMQLPDNPMPEGLKDSLYASYLAGMFRSIRFGIGSAHGGGVAIQLNYHLENGGFVLGEDGFFSLDEQALKASVESLASKLLLIELRGDYNGAQALIDTYRHITPQVQLALDKLENVPIDVRKIYPFD